MPILLLTEVFIDQGISKTAALSRARNLILEDPTWSSVIGIIQGLLWYVLVYFLIRVINKETCDLKSFGLDIRGKNFLLILLGFNLGLLLYFGYFWVSHLINQGQFVWSPATIDTVVIILITLHYFINGLGEETAFRAYWQSKLIRRHRLWIGVIVAK
jgi:membrane protease YdiL (CAAX protease family)